MAKPVVEPFPSVFLQHRAIEQTKDYKKPTQYYPELDALRGVAALVVVLGHFGRLWELSSTAQPLLFLLQSLGKMGGTAAVILFFLLSGFVLSLPYKRGTSLPYGSFALRRISRIYVPYLAAVLLAVLGYWQFRSWLPISAWFNQTWTAPLTGRVILSSALLIGNYDTSLVNTAFWSLAVEMRLSLLFPLLCLPLLRGGRRVVALGIWAAVILDIVISRPLHQYFDADTLRNLTDMTLGLMCFVAGIVLSRYQVTIQNAWNGLRIGEHRLFFVSSMLILVFGGLLGNVHHIGFVANTVQILGGVGVLASVLFSKGLRRVLNHRLPVLLGRMSYSLYLVHGTVLFALVHFFFGRTSLTSLFVPYLMCSLGVAWIFFISVEKPAIWLSRQIGTRTPKAMPVHELVTVP